MCRSIWSIVLFKSAISLLIMSLNDLSIIGGVLKEFMRFIMPSAVALNEG